MVQSTRDTYHAEEEEGDMDLNNEIPLLHLSDLTLPAGVTSVDLSHGEEHDNAILSITKVKVRGGDEEEGEGDAEASAE